MIYVLIASIILTLILFVIYVRKNLKLSEEMIPSLNIDLDNITICRQMLKIIKNNHTNVEYNKDKTSNLSYYNHKKDVIILKSKNTGSSRIVQIAHECIHTTQNKEFLIANKIFSNLQLIYLFISLIYIINNEVNELLIITIQLLILLGTIIVKMVIEGDASYRSIALVEKYLQEKVDEEELMSYINTTSKLIYDLIPVYYFNFFSQGIVMIIINTIIALI